MDMYGELILDHCKRPVGAGLREGYAAQVHHINPTCGDRGHPPRPPFVG